ncbi:MAG: penicillin acylase family protein [Rhodobacterales bacterium]|nr:MAG: penicillin acylase family protein [Rhodobacterales bacterium]
MPTLFRWLFRIAAGLVALTTLTILLIYWFAARSLPDYDATQEVSGISAPVEIVRDNANVPHIFGETDEDVFFGLGYAHAQDRMWQMTFMRRAVQGRLSELFGTDTLQTDVLLRRLDLYTAARESLDDQSPATRAALTAYAAGVNAWLEEVRDGAKGRGAPEMWLFNHPIAPWSEADSLAITKLMALQLSSHLEEEVLRARLSLYLDADIRLQDLLPDAPGPGIGALPRYADLVPGVPRYMANTRPPFSPLSPVKPRALAGASNAWAADASRSTSGSTLLASDPHLGFTAPTIWYLARLELSSGGVIGGTVPGIPAVLIGRNAALGWGLTTAYMDDQDLYLEEVNSEDATLYRTQDGWAPFRTRDSIVTVKDAPAVTVKLQWTENGPVLGDEDFDLGTIRKPGHVVSLAWPATRGDDTSLTAAMDIMRAQTVQEALRAAENYVTPAQNITLADRNHIAIATIGAMPKRDPQHQSQGRLPTFGYIERNRWQGYFPFAENPVFVDPEGGILGNTNNKLVNRPFPRHVSFHYGDTQRVHRWRKLMQEREVHTRESFISAQLDTVSFTARVLLPLIGADLWFTGDPAPKGTPERRRQIALELLADWNGEMNEHLPEPMIYAYWLRALQNRLIRDDLGPLADEFTHVEPLFIERVFRNYNGAGAWCDVRQSAPVETCAQIAKVALDDALVEIAEDWGTSLESLRWGDAHQATHDHPVLGDVPILSWIVNIRQSTSGGDNTLLRGRTEGGEGPQAFLNVHGAGYRGVYDFADPEASVFIISTGQSGHPLSRHYDDLGTLWRRGEYLQMSLDPALARAAAVGITHLEPAAP